MKLGDCSLSRSKFMGHIFQTLQSWASPHMIQLHCRCPSTPGTSHRNESGSLYLCVSKDPNLSLYCVTCRPQCDASVCTDSESTAQRAGSQAIDQANDDVSPVLLQSCQDWTWAELGYLCHQTIVSISYERSPFRSPILRLAWGEIEVSFHWVAYDFRYVALSWRVMFIRGHLQSNSIFSLDHILLSLMKQHALSL